MKRFVGLFTLLLLLLSIQTMKAYELTINATSDVADITTYYNYRVWDLNTYTLSMGGGFVTSPDTLNLEEGNYVLYGKVMSQILIINMQVISFMVSMMN